MSSMGINRHTFGSIRSESALSVAVSVFSLGKGRLLLASCDFALLPWENADFCKASKNLPMSLIPL